MSAERGARPALLLLAPLALAAAGCGDPYGLGNCQPDAVPTAASRGVLAGYGDEPARPVAPARPLTSLPVSPGPAVTLPGAPERPWSGAPRSMPGQESGGAEAAAPAAGRSPEAATGPAPARRRLAAGDAVDVLVELHPEFSGRWRVEPGGLLEVPEGLAFGPDLLSAGDFARGVGRVAGLAPEEAARRISAVLQPYVVKPPVVKVTPAERREN